MKLSQITTFWLVVAGDIQLKDKKDILIGMYQHSKYRNQIGNNLKSDL